jgi:hypothetical protein
MHGQRYLVNRNFQKTKSPWPAIYLRRLVGAFCGEKKGNALFGFRRFGLCQRVKSLQEAIFEYKTQ